MNELKGVMRGSQIQSVMTEEDKKKADEKWQEVLASILSKEE